MLNLVSQKLHKLWRKVLDPALLNASVKRCRTMMPEEKRFSFLSSTSPFRPKLVLGWTIRLHQETLFHQACCLMLPGLTKRRHCLQEKGASEIVLKAMGRAINKTVTIAEILKVGRLCRQNHELWCKVKLQGGFVMFTEGGAVSWLQVMSKFSFENLWCSS